MAVDTRQKRQSAAGIQHGVPVPVLPSGTFDQAQRQAAGWGYYGILVGAPVEVPVATSIVLAAEAWEFDDPSAEAWKFSDPAPESWEYDEPDSESWEVP